MTDASNDKKMSEKNSFRYLGGEMFGPEKGLGESHQGRLVRLPIKLYLMAFKRFVNPLQSTPLPLDRSPAPNATSLTVDYHFPSIGSDCGVVFQTVYDHL